jgi:hypothetical protein
MMTQIDAMFSHDQFLDGTARYVSVVLLESGLKGTVSLSSESSLTVTGVATYWPRPVVLQYFVCGCLWTPKQCVTLRTSNPSNLYVFV